MVFRRTVCRTFVGFFVEGKKHGFLDFENFNNMSVFCLGLLNIRFNFLREQ